MLAAERGQSSPTNLLYIVPRRPNGTVPHLCKAAMRTSHIRDPDDLLAYIAGALEAQGRPVDAGMVVELEPLFRDVFLGGEITRLDRVVEAATAGGRLLRPVGGEGRRFALTEAGAEQARSARRGFIGRLPMWQRLLLIAVILALVLAVLAQ